MERIWLLILFSAAETHQSVLERGIKGYCIVVCGWLGNHLEIWSDPHFTLSGVSSMEISSTGADLALQDLPPTSVRRGCNAITSAGCTSMEKFQGHKLRSGAWFYRRQPGVSCLIFQKGTSPKSVSPMQVSLIPEVTSEALVKVCSILELFVQRSSARSTAASCLPRSLWRQGPSSPAS